MKIFTQHPKTIGETYLQHLGFALSFGGNMVIGGIACIIHAIFPFVFEKTGSDFLLKMTKRFVERMPEADERTLTIARIIQSKNKK